MASLTNKTIANSYKDLLQVGNNGNGIASTQIHTVKDGDGGDSSLQLGKRGTIVKPTVDTVSTFIVQDSGGNSILTARSNDSQVLAGSTQSFVNSQYLRFFGHDIDVDNGTHFGVPIVGFYTSGSAEVPNTELTFGTGTNPGEPTITGSGDDIIHYAHFVDTNITVDAVNVLFAANGSGSDTLTFHLISFESAGTGNAVDELNTVTVIADDSGQASTGHNQFYRVALDIQSANVNAGKYLFLTVEGNGTNADYTINAQVRYHFR